MRKLVLTLIALGVLHSFVLGGEEKPKLNVIVIFCDDLGYGELPVYRKLYQESEEFKTAIGSFTPHLDRLAREGVVLVDDFKIMKIWQDRTKKDKYSYQFQHLSDMVGKPKPWSSLMEDYYEDNINDPEKKEAMIKQLESLLQGEKLQ